MTMPSLRRAQSTLLAKQFADMGNLIAAAFVRGPFISAPAVFILGLVARCHNLVGVDGRRTIHGRKGATVTDQPLVGVFVIGGTALLYGFVILTLDWCARRNQHRKE